MHGMHGIRHGTEAAGGVRAGRPALSVATRKGSNPFDFEGSEVHLGTPVTAPGLEVERLAEATSAMALRSGRGSV